MHAEIKTTSADRGMDPATRLPVDYYMIAMTKGKKDLNTLVKEYKE